ncbi:DUF2790 domain-containing protein, partial [Pseudomonas aeruginosa]|uniref:DUF2790 domain-containing protein n=1 Tax=Pseudomonas aeruginosa TaxID=287 RepID=UPI002358D682
NNGKQLDVKNVLHRTDNSTRTGVVPVTVVYELRLDKALRNRGVQVAVGCIFSASGKYRNCLRMNYAALPTPAIEQAVRRVGESACELLEPCEA